MFKLSQIVFIFFFTAVSSAVCLDNNISDCVEDLGRLEGVVGDAFKIAEEVETVSEELEYKKDELRECVDNPDVMSPTWDNCKSLRADCKLLEKTYKEKLKNLESAFKNIADEISSVEWSCGVQFNKSEKTVQDNCEIFKSLKNKIPIKELLDLCKKSMSGEECKKCLNIE